MGDEEATRVCDCCKKAVAKANFALHESHCRRFLVLCPDCDENVPRSELETHREEQHTQVRCPKCRKKMERRLLAEHEEEECVARLQACDYCELEMAWSELQEHVVACGSRTERCPDCGRYVKLSDTKEHNKTCSGQDLYNEEPSSSQRAYRPVKAAMREIKVLCKICMIRFSANEIKEHEIKCTAAPKWNETESDSDSDDDVNGGVRGAYGVDFRQMRNMFRNQTKDLSWTRKPNREVSGAETWDPKELGTCSHCQLTLPHTTLRWHEGKCKLHISLKHREATPVSLV